MILEKDGKVVTLDNAIHIKAYKNSGWAETEEMPQPKPPEEPRRRKPKEEQPAE